LGIITPTDELIVFRGVGIPPTRYPWAELTSVFAPKVKVFVTGRVARAGGWLAIL